MRLIFDQIKAFHQPAKLGECAGFYGRVWITRPRKFIDFESLLPQAKSVAVPVQCFDLCVLSVGEDIQCTGKWVQA